MKIPIWLICRTRIGGTEMDQYRSVRLANVVVMTVFAGHLVDSVAGIFFRPRLFVSIK